MEPVLLVADRPRRGRRGDVDVEAGGGAGGDETKYDDRVHRDRFAALYRSLVVAMALLGVLTLVGGGVLANGHKAARRPVPGEVERPHGDDYEATWRQRFKEDDEDLQSEQPLDVDVGMPGPGAGAVDAAPPPAAGGGDGGGDGGGGPVATSAPDEASSPLPPPPPPPPPPPLPARAGGPPGGEDALLDAMPDPVPTWDLEPPATCGGYFGNGYSDAFAIAGGPPPGDGDDWGAAPAPPGSLWCRAHPHTRGVFCRGGGVVLDPARIKVSRGGEALDAVMGRVEDDELPVFAAGALALYAGPLGGVARAADGAPRLPRAPAGGGAPLPPDFEKVDPYKARMLLTAVSVAAAPAPGGGDVPGGGGGDGGEPLWCASVVPDRVLLLTRVEYANLFHTSTDWYNVWQVARLLGSAPTTDYAEEALRGLTPEAARAEDAAPRARTPRLPVHVVFLDGHNASPMDDGWRALVLSVNYIAHFGGPACFADAVFAPYGYHAAVSQGIEPRSNQCYSEPHVRQFGYDFVRALGLPPRRAAACGESPTPVLFVRRVHYMAHPRHNGQIVRRLDNEDAIVAALEAGAAAGGVRLLNGLFSSMRLMEQVQAAQDACLIVGAHGAGLSHVLFAPDGVRVLELQPPMFARPHFIAYTAWAGGTHSAWHLTSSWPNEAQVVARVLAEAARAAGRAGDEPAAAAPGGGGVAAAWDGVARGPRGRGIVGAPPRA